MFRLNQKHSKKTLGKPAPANASALLGAQSARRALIGAVGSVVVLNIVWVWTSAITGKFFPWFGVLQGLLVGMVVQRMGRGLDWKFPAIAGVVAGLGSLAGGFMVALSTTEVELQASAISILRGLTFMTWEIYFDEMVTPVDYIYAFCAAVVAVFFSRRRLSRQEEFALRTAFRDKTKREDE